MKISHRLYVTVAPGILGVIAIAALGYWGQYQRQAPELFIELAAAAAVISLVTAWSNARFIAQRIERLAGTSASADERLGSNHDASSDATSRQSLTTLRGVVSAVAPAHVNRPPDEIDQIEQTVDRLSRAVDVAESDRAVGERRLEERVRDHARLMAAVADDATRRLDEVKLPLHILLENRFGELNENQEEMLGSARAAAEAIDMELVSLRRIAELDLGERQIRIDRVRPSEIIESIRPLLDAAAQAQGAVLHVEIAPLLPALNADRAQLQEALVTLFRLAIEGVEASAPLELTVGAMGAAGDSLRDAKGIELLLLGGTAPRKTIHGALAARIVVAHGGTLEKRDGVLRVTLPV